MNENDVVEAIKSLQKTAKDLFIKVSEDEFVIDVNEVKKFAYKYLNDEIKKLQDLMRKRSPTEKPKIFRERCLIELRSGLMVAVKYIDEYNDGYNDVAQGEVWQCLLTDMRFSNNAITGWWSIHHLSEGKM